MNLAKILGVAWIMAMLPSSLLSSIPFVKAIANVKVGFLVMSPADLVIPIVFCIFVIKMPAIITFARFNRRLCITYALFIVWAAVLLGISFLTFRGDISDLSIGVMRLIKFVAFSIWCPLVWVAVRKRQDRALLSLFFLIGILLFTFQILAAARSAIDIASSTIGPKGMIKAELPFLGNAASVLLATATCALIPMLGSKVSRLIWILPITAAMFVTTGRAGYVGLAVGLAFIVYKWRKWGAFIAVAGVSIIMLIASQVPIIANALGSLTGSGQQDFLFMDTNGRLDVYYMFFREIAMDKLLLGAGFGVWGPIAGLPYYTMHNFFLQMWAELGIFGMLLFIWLCVEVYRGPPYKNGGKGSASIGACAALLACSAASMTETYFYGGPILGVVSFSVGLALASEKDAYVHRKPTKLYYSLNAIKYDKHSNTVL